MTSERRLAPPGVQATTRPGLAGSPTVRIVELRRRLSFLRRGPRGRSWLSERRSGDPKTLLPDTEVAEDDVQKLVDAHRAGDPADRPQRQPEVFGRQRDLGSGKRAAQGLAALLQRFAMTRAGERWRAGALLHQRLGRPLQPLQQRGQARLR